MEVVAASSTDSRRQEASKSKARSRVSNGRDVLPGIDGRSLIARRYRDIANAILVDQAGEELCSEARKQLIRRFAAAAVLAEQMESKLANGEQINIQEHAVLSSTLVRLAAKIGIDRVPKSIGPSFGDFLRADLIERRATEAAGNGTLTGELLAGSGADPGDDGAAP